MSGRRALGSFMVQLFGYIYCMLVSNALLNVPFFGGALYLASRAVEVYGSVYRRKFRRFLPGYARRWNLLLLIILVTMVVLLTGLYPSRLNSPRVWIMLALIALGMAADILFGSVARLLHGEKRITFRLCVALGGCLMLLYGLAAWALIRNLGIQTGLSLTIGFVLRTVLQAYAGAGALLPQEELPSSPDTTQFNSLRAYRSFTWISMLLVIAMEMTMAVIYALLAVRAEDLAGSMGAGVLCAVIAGEAGRFFLRRSEKKNPRAPTVLLVLGLLIWAFGVVLCSLMIAGGRMEPVRIYLCLSSATLGGVWSITGLLRIDDALSRVAELGIPSVPASYRLHRKINWDFATLVGDTLALIFLSIFCFTTGDALPHDVGEFTSRFQPLMMIPLVLVLLGAILSVLRFPLNARHLERLRRFLQLQETGEENPSLRRQLQEAAEEKHGLPFLSDMLVFVLRRLYRHRLEGQEHVVIDNANPLVFLCNHGEFYGPVVCELFLPVPVRAWTISHMMLDRKEVSDYVYQYTIGPIQWMPEWLKRFLAWFSGHLSMTVMRQMESIPVYRDSPMKLRETIRLSVEALEAGDHLLIFPENPDQKYVREGIGSLNSGFVMLGSAYWRRSGKRLRLMPVYADKANRILHFGREIQFDPDRPYAEEQSKIVREVEEQIRHMAETGKEGMAE